MAFKPYSNKYFLGDHEEGREPKRYESFEAIPKSERQIPVGQVDPQIFPKLKENLNIRQTFGPVPDEGGNIPSAHMSFTYLDLLDHGSLRDGEDNRFGSSVNPGRKDAVKLLQDHKNNVPGSRKDLAEAITRGIHKRQGRDVRAESAGGKTQRGAESKTLRDHKGAGRDVRACSLKLKKYCKKSGILLPLYCLIRVFLLDI